MLFGHGARNPEWAQPFHRIRDMILSRAPEALVEPGFLELLQPTFDEAVDCLVRQGATDIVVVPIFMAAGKHVNKDLPQMAANAMDRHAGLAITLAPAVGEAAPVLAAMADYALAAGSAG
jgi:sirohydrochlorin cobaltochelatase